MKTEISYADSTPKTVEAPVEPPKVEISKDEPGTTSLLFLGGCHIKGHLVNSHSSFVNLSVKVLHDYHLKTKLNLEAHVLIKHAPKVISLIQAHTPDILVFQLGNFELYPKESLGDLVKREIKARWNGTSAAYTPIKVARKRAVEIGSDPVDIYSKKSWWTEKVELVKHWRHAFICKLLGKSLIDEELVAKQTDELFAAVKAQGVGRVVILSPLPSSSKTTQWYRRKGAVIFEKYARKHDLGYLDLERYLNSDEANFLDGMHLNSLGHEKLGYVLGIHLRNLILSPQAYKGVVK